MCVLILRHRQGKKVRVSILGVSVLLMQWPVIFLGASVNSINCYIFAV